MPTISLTEIYAQAKPWDLSLELDGHVLNVKRLNAVDIARIQHAANLNDAEARQVIADLFAEPVDVSGWDSEKIAIVVVAITEYFKEAVVKKKLADVAAAAGAAARTKR